MTIYLHLPVYKASYDLALEIFKTVKEFNREYKYTLGENIKKEAIEMITNNTYKLRKKMLVKNLSPNFGDYIYVADDYGKIFSKI